MRNPLNLRNRSGETTYFDTYVQSPFAEDNRFRTRARRNVEWPEFPHAKANVLPVPHWPGHAAALACYWRCWQIAFDNFRPATDENGFVSDYSSTMFNDCLYIWDSVFITLFGRYGDRAWKFQNTLDNFYGKQHPDGGICRQFREGNGTECYSRFDPAGSGPNVIGWSEWEYYLRFGDRARLAEVFPALVSYGQWFRRYRTWPDGSYWGTGISSGMDNQPRTPFGPQAHLDHGHRAWVDANMQQVLANRVVLSIADVLGRSDEVQDFAEENAALIAWVNQHLWDETSGFYHDLRRDHTRLTEVKTIGAFWALLADVVPPERMARFLSHLENPNEFGRVHRIPSLSADTPGYDADGGLWLGGVWAPTNYMVVRGLSERGQDDLAYALALNHFDSVVSSFEATGSLYEHFAPDAPAEGRGRADFVGWTGITPIAFLFEYMFGLNYDHRKKKLIWNVRALDEFGVSRYPVGPEGSLSLLCGGRGGPTEKPKCTIKSNVEIDVELRWAGGVEALRVAPE